MFCFIDESGNLGTKDRFFVIAMLVPQKPKRISNFVKKFCAENKLLELKGSQLSFPQKQELFNKLNFANDYSVAYVVADKSNINAQLSEDKNLLFNYLFSFLVKKTIRSSTGDLEFVLDNHSVKTKSINSLSDYIKIKARFNWYFKNKIVVRYTDSKDSKIVQATDIIANAIFAKYNRGKAHFYNQIIISESIKFPIGKFNINP